MLKHLPDGRTVIIFETKPGDILALDVTRRGATVWRVPDQVPGQGHGTNRGALWGGALDDRTAYLPGGRTGIAAFGISDGQRRWSTRPGAAEDPKVQYSAAVTAIPGVLFACASDGGLWALSSDDGHTLWSYQTAHPFTTVNAVPAHGGSISSAGATVAGGMLFVGSGYGVVSDSPGNVLLAFGIQ
jgi:polyvinyl alcohol dehydrogenase (cytochrome)